ncbi:hypothetical protein llg_24410 [Luteolibacter sp. LG18]|nr:hypothetical protein llg_24410 [Luteolibacter sp. LG18]
MAIPGGGTLTLVNQTGFNKLTVTFDPGLASTSTSTLTGTLPITLDADPATGRVSALTIVNGRISGTTLTFHTFLYNLTITGLGAAVTTPTPPGVVTPATGQFDATQYQTAIDQGSMTGTVFGSPVDWTFTPQEPAIGSGTGTGTIALTNGVDSGIYRNFTATLTLPVSVDDTTVTDSGTVRITSTGTIKATGTVQIPKTSYLAWTVAQGAAGASFATVSNRLPNGLRWALGIGMTADPLLYLPKSRAGVPQGFSLPFPATGTGGPVTVLVSTGLGTWTTLPASRLSTGVNPIPAGTVGEVTVSPGTAAKEFIRLKATEP